MRRLVRCEPTSDACVRGCTYCTPATEESGRGCLRQFRVETFLIRRSHLEEKAALIRGDGVEVNNSKLLQISYVDDAKEKGSRPTRHRVEYSVVQKIFPPV